MRTRIIAVAVAALLIVPMPQEAQFLGGFATEVTQILNHGQLLMDYIRQGQQLTTALQQYAEMVRNGRALPSQIFGPIQADLNALASIVQGGMSLAYSMSNLDAQFRARFPGYGITPGSYYANYQTWAQTSLDTTAGTLRAAGLQGQQLQSEQAVLSQLRSMASTSNGQMQAVQVAGELSEQQVQQLMKLRELMLADMSSKQAYQAAVIQREAASEAATERFFTYTPSASDGKTFLPGWN